MKKFNVWLSGIVGSIIVGWAVWFLTKPTVPPPPPAVTTFEGMVYSGDAPVPKAMVALELTGTTGSNGPVHDVTDANGAYRFDFTGLPPTAGANVSVDATGYDKVEAKAFASPLQTEIRFDFPLSAIVVAAVVPAPPPGQVAGPAAAPVPAPVPAHGAIQFHPVHPVEQIHPAQPRTFHIPMYMRKSAAQAMKITIPSK